MKRKISVLALLLGCAMVLAGNDPAMEEAKKINITCPVSCREWHIWWSVPYGNGTGRTHWFHWKGERRFGKYAPAKGLEMLRPGSGWRRWLNSEGYPLFGPYDSWDTEIIRWQLRSAKNAGLATLYLHIWPSLWDAGQDMTPLPLIQKIFDIAAEEKFPIGIHDEIAFRRPPITKAQDPANTVRRIALFIQRYGSHPGWRKIDGMPVYYFQNWTSWIMPSELAQVVKETEKITGPVYWIVEMGMDEKVYAIPEIKAVMAYHNGDFIFRNIPPSQYPWDRVYGQTRKAMQLAHKYGKKYGIMVYSRFNHTYDRGKPGDLGMAAERGKTFIKALRMAAESNPDFIILTQWNDFEECGYIEPAWDYADSNGDPYRYLRLTAAALKKEFRPAPLPPRSSVDPYIRHKLYGDTKPGDLGPVAQMTLQGRALSLVMAKETPKAEKLVLVQNSLARWTAGMQPYPGKEKISLGNLSRCDGVLQGNGELRFFCPGLKNKTVCPRYLGIRFAARGDGIPQVRYRRTEENYRIDSRWARMNADLKNGYQFPSPDGSRWFFLPLHQECFTGDEGDLTISAEGKMRILEVVIYSPEMQDFVIPPAAHITLPEGLDAKQTFIAVLQDQCGNPGMPVLFPGSDPKVGAELPPLPEIKRAPRPPKKIQVRKSYPQSNGWNVVCWNGPKQTADADGGACLEFRNGLASKKLAQELKPGTPFRIRFEALHKNYRRGFSFRLTQDPDGNGIGIFWDSSAGGGGFIRFEKVPPHVQFTQSCTVSPLQNVPHKATELPLVKFELEWANGVYTVTADGKKILTYKGDFPGAKYVLIRGNDSQLFRGPEAIK